MRDGWTIDGESFAGKHAEHLEVVGDELVMSMTEMEADPERASRPLAGGSGWRRSRIRECPGDIGTVWPLLGPSGDALLVAGLRSDEEAMIEWHTKDGCEVVAGPCDARHVYPSFVGPSAKPMMSYRCGSRSFVARRDDSGWATVAELPDSIAIAAIAGDGTIVAADTSADPGAWWTIHDGTVTPGRPPGRGQWSALAACGGKVFGTYYRLPDEVLDFGVLSGANWSFAPLGTREGLGIPKDLVPHGRIAFDDACRAFVAVEDKVYERGETWVALPSPGGVVYDLLVHRSTLVVAFAEGGEMFDRGPLRVASRAVTSSRP